MKEATGEVTSLRYVQGKGRAATPLATLLAVMVLVGLLSLFSGTQARGAESVIVVVIDGARYSETLGDSTRSCTPNLWRLSAQGAMVVHFQNDSFTTTSRALPALWCGTWTEVRDTVYQGVSTRYAVKPTIFEYYRKERHAPASDCFYVLKKVQGLWLASFHADFGPEFWPSYFSQGSSDEEVAANALWVMATYHPRLLWIYFADVDAAGHSGDWLRYRRAIAKADSIVALLWDQVEADQFYRGATTLLVTNDHGRHDDRHEGFQGHGDGCEGCRHILFLALGADVQKGLRSALPRRLPDVAVTAAALLGIKMPTATGEVMSELLVPASLGEGVGQETRPYVAGASVFPNPFAGYTEVRFFLRQAAEVTVEVYDIAGRQVAQLTRGFRAPGWQSVRWLARDDQGRAVAPGIYLWALRVGAERHARKVLLLCP